jgi:hypothetical protein
VPDFIGHSNQPYFPQENVMSSLAKVPLTVVGAEALRAELHRLKTVERPSVILAIAEARAQGDLSENAEYDAAKEKQGFVEGRIQELEGKMSSAQIIDPKLLDDEGRVVFADFARHDRQICRRCRGRPCARWREGI